MKRYVRSIATAAVVAGAGASLLSGAVTAGAQSAGSLPTLKLTVTARSLTVGGPLQSGAMNVVTTMTGRRHSEPTLVRLNSGVPFSAFPQAVAAVDAHAGDLNYVDPYGSIVFDVSADSATSSAQTTLQPGNYIAIDLSSQSPDPPHATFTISPAKHPAVLPKPGATITAVDFAFRSPTRLHDGELVRFENGGFLVHQIQGIGVRNARAARRLTAALLAGKDSEAKKLALSAPEFAGPLSTGASQQELVNQRPGVYVLVCILRTQDGREHTRLGMERTIEIVK